MCNLRLHYVPTALPRHQQHKSQHTLRRRVERMSFHELLDNAIFLAAVVALVSIPVFGWLSDRIGRDVLCELPLRDGVRLSPILAT